MNNIKKSCLIVLNYNDAPSCLSLIAKVENYHNIQKIILVDNCSTDSSFDVLKDAFQNHQKIDVIKTEANGGYGSGNTFGAFYAMEKYDAQFITIANPDVEFREKTLDRILKQYDEYSDAAIVTCKMNCSAQKLPVAWKLPSYWDCILENFIILSKIVENRCLYKEKELDRPVVKVEVLPGSFLTMKASCFKEIGGFDSSIFLYYEENILAKKMQRAGYSSYLITTEEYLHNNTEKINKNISSNEK